jgi:hypothetical protein
VLLCGDVVQISNICAETPYLPTQGFLTMDKTSKKYMFTHIEIPSILWALDSNTGETEYRALVNTMGRVPELQRFQHEFPRNFRFPSTDKHGANIRAENAYKTANVNVNTCPIYCTVHPMATSLHQSFGVTTAKETVSGMVNIGLAVAGSGSVAKVSN